MTRRLPPELCWRWSIAHGLPIPQATAPLRLIEWCMLWLIQADPRLSARNHRQRLRRLMASFDASFADNRRVGDALVRLKDLMHSGVVSTRGFDVTDAVPSTAEREVAFMATLLAFGRQCAPPERMGPRREASTR